MALVEFAKYMSAAEAQIVKGRLEAGGVISVVFDTGVNIVEGIGIAFPARVMVLDEDLKDAHAIMAEDVSL